MSKKIILGFVLLTILLSVVACNDNSAQNNEPIKATWIEPRVVGDTMSIPVNEVENNWNVHFNLKTQGSDMNFMAYVLD